MCGPNSSLFEIDNLLLRRGSKWFVEQKKQPSKLQHSFENRKAFFAKKVFVQQKNGVAISSKAQPSHKLQTGVNKYTMLACYLDREKKRPISLHYTQMAVW